MMKDQFEPCLKGLVNLQNHFKTLYDLNDIDEKTKFYAENPILKFQQSQKLCKFKNYAN